jgi:hypothetical protein
VDFKALKSTKHMQPERFLMSLLVKLSNVLIAKTEKISDIPMNPSSLTYSQKMLSKLSKNNSNNVKFIRQNKNKNFYSFKYKKIKLKA